MGNWYSLGLACFAFGDFSHRIEVFVFHCISWSDTLRMIIQKHFREEINCILSAKMFVIWIYKLLPGFLRAPEQNVSSVSVSLQVSVSGFFNR